MSKPRKISVEFSQAWQSAADNTLEQSFVYRHKKFVLVNFSPLKGVLWKRDEQDGLNIIGKIRVMVKA